MLIVFLILIFVRPFISSLAFGYAEMAYTTILMVFFTILLLPCGEKKVMRGLRCIRSTPSPLPSPLWGEGSCLNLKSIKYPLIFFVLSLILSSVFSFNKTVSAIELNKYAVSILAFLFVASLNIGMKRRVIYTIMLAGFLIAVLAVYQYFFGFSNLADYISKKQINNSFVHDYIASKRIFFPFVTPNALAGYLAMILPIALIARDKDKWIAIPAVFLALILTKSLGAFIALTAGLIFYLYLTGKIGKKRIAAVPVFLLSAAMLILICIFVIRMSSTKNHLLPEFSFSQRLIYWQDAAKIIIAHPLTGIGPGNFNLQLSRYAHNSYLQLWAETGLFGLVSFLWLVFMIFKKGMENIKRNFYKKETICLLTASLIFLLHNTVDFTFFLPEVCLVWWAILGCTTS